MNIRLTCQQSLFMKKVSSIVATKELLQHLQLALLQSISLYKSISPLRSQLLRL